MFDEVGYADGAMLNYVAHYTDKNPWLPQVVALDVPVGKTIVDEDLIDSRTYEAKEFYNDWVQPPKSLLHDRRRGAERKNASAPI